MKRTGNRIVSLLIAIVLIFALLPFLSPAASASEMKTAIGTVTASALRLRKGPSTSYDILDVAPRGDAVLVIGAEGDWYKVIYNLQTGYMHGDYLTLEEVKQIKIGYARFEYGTNIRQGPGTEQRILACAPSGDTCVIEGFDHGWFKISYRGIESAYVRSDLVTMLEIPYSNYGSQGNTYHEEDNASGKSACFLYNTNVRSGPGTGYDILTCARAGETCTIRSVAQNWYQVSYNSIDGYVRSDLVAVQDSTGGGNQNLANGDMTRSEKLRFIFGTADIDDPREVYSNSYEAQEHMTSVTVKTWDINSSGEKYTRTWTLNVHENIAATVEAIFDEIYALPEQPPIHSLGGYRWAGLSEHSVGLAIDINPNENYYCDPDGNALTGSYFRPGEDPYSIPVGGSIDQIFARYGFTRGIYWHSGYKDYMHYSFFGT